MRSEDGNDGFRWRSTHPTVLRTKAIANGIYCNIAARSKQRQHCAAAICSAVSNFKLTSLRLRAGNKERSYEFLPRVRYWLLHRCELCVRDAGLQHGNTKTRKDTSAYSTVSSLERSGRRRPQENVGGRRPRSQTGAALPPVAIGDPRKGRAARTEASGAAGAPAGGGRTPRVLTRAPPLRHSSPFCFAARCGAQAHVSCCGCRAEAERRVRH